MNTIDTDAYSRQLRGRAVDMAARTLMIADLSGTAQEDDLTEPVNCGGYGRIRHFRRAASSGWPPNPLPIDPAACALGLPAGLESLTAQVFQNAACQWPCIH
jgi:hypothetical protein